MIPAPVGTSPGARRPGVRALDGARWSASAVRPRLEKARGLLRVSSPEGAGTAVLGGRRRPGTTSTWRSGCRGLFRSRLRGRPAREGRLLSRRTPANRLGPETGPLAGVPACTRAGSPTLGASRRRPVHIRARVNRPGGQETFLAGPLRGHGFAWSGLVCCASRGGARGQPVVPLRPSLRASRARSGGVFRRAPAWQSPSLLEGGGSPSRPVAAAPLSSVRHSALAGRAGTVRRLPEEAAGSGSCYRQGRTGEGDSGRTPRQGDPVPSKCSSGTVATRAWSPTTRVGAWVLDESGSRRPVCGKARCGGRASVSGGSPKRTWFTGVNHDPPKRTVRARRSGTWWSAGADRSDPPKRTSETPAGRSVVSRPYGRSDGPESRG